MIYVVANTLEEESKFFKYASFEQFIEWESKQVEWALDIESNVVPSIVDRVLITVQLGDISGHIQYVIQWSHLTGSQKEDLKRILECSRKTKLIHNAVFEYTLLYKYNIIINNIYDTMLVEKVITTGWNVQSGFYSLAGLMKRYMFMEMSKEEQTTFGDDILTEDKIVYAAEDVKHLGKIRRLQKYKVDEYNLHNVCALENEAVLSFSEIEYNGMLLDKDAWRENIKHAQPIIDDARDELETYIRGELKIACTRLGFYNPDDTVNISWTSPQQRQKVLKMLIPGLEGATAPIVKKYMKGTTDNAEYLLLEKYLAKEYSYIEDSLIWSHRDWLIEEGFLIKGDSVNINWSSPVQRLKVFKIVEPHLKGTSKEDLADADHPIIEKYQEYISYTKLVSSFGEEFINKHVHPDGRVRTRFNQILNTGRVSSSGPNMQQIPAGEKVGNRYRNCFIEDEGWVFVDSDYSSQELCVIAYLAKEDVWIDALKDNKDLHSICAELVFGDKWSSSAETGCKFYELDSLGNLKKDKCSCKKHKSMRTLVKTISFGLCYGMSEYKLSATAKISIEEAKETIADYFKAFPKIGGLLNRLGNFGVAKGYIITPPPFLRRRFFDYWEKRRDNDYWMGKVKRASMNMPVQGGSSDMMKLAMVLIRGYIHDNNLRDKVRLTMVVHDQASCSVREDYAEEWKVILDRLMCDAAKFIIPNGLLTADTNISLRWSK